MICIILCSPMVLVVCALFLFIWLCTLDLNGLFNAFKIGVCEDLKIGFLLISRYGASIAQPSRAAAS